MKKILVTVAMLLALFILMAFICNSLSSARRILSSTPVAIAPAAIQPSEAKATNTPYIPLTSTPVTPTEAYCQPGFLQIGNICAAFTETPTATETGPTPTLEPTATLPDYTKTAKSGGSYMVGSEMASGIWRSSGVGSTGSGSCYLEIKDLSGETKDITGDPPGGTFRVPSGDYVVVIDGYMGSCTWSFLKP